MSRAGVAHLHRHPSATASIAVISNRTSIIDLSPRRRSSSPKCAQASARPDRTPCLRSPRQAGRLRVFHKFIPTLPARFSVCSFVSEIGVVLLAMEDLGERSRRFPSLSSGSVESVLIECRSSDPVFYRRSSLLHFSWSFHHSSHSLNRPGVMSYSIQPPSSHFGQRSIL